MDNKRVSVLIKINEEDLSGLDFLAREDERTRSSMIRCVIKDFVRSNMNAEKKKQLAQLGGKVEVPEGDDDDE